MGFEEPKLIDVSPIEVTDLSVQDEHLKAEPPLVFQVEFDKCAACYTLEGDFEIYLYAFSREELESSLIELLQFMWRDYAKEDDTKLTEGAQQLKLDMLHRLRRV